MGLPGSLFLSKNGGLDPPGGHEGMMQQKDHQDIDLLVTQNQLNRFLECLFIPGKGHIHRIGADGQGGRILSNSF